MPDLQLSVPTHLSIFVFDPETGQPVQRLPLYVEVAAPRIVPVPPINERFREPMRSVLIDTDPTANDPDVRPRVEAAALLAVAEAVDEPSRSSLEMQPDRVRELFRLVFEQILEASGRTRMADIPPEELKPLLVAAIRRIAPEFELGLVPEIDDAGVTWADPLGVLTTDHVGYVSFDLRRLRPDVQMKLAEAIEERRGNPDADVKLAIWVYPYGHPGRFDALSQARFALDAVVARLAMKWNTLPPALINMGPRALQNPSLTDWRLSPASFAATPKTLVGEGGCEELVPANLALQEFVLRQVVRLADVPPGFDTPANLKAAYVDEYKVSWFSLGHSLGEILYSLPLAPGETVRLAVIDWSWDSLTTRDETTRLTEDVLHRTHRDRTITETVKAGLQELQRGSSFMGGMAGSGGGSGGANLGVVGIGAAVGHSWSLGGSTATSAGSRDLAAENVQRLNDSFSQASSAHREINSTVVIQARQEEKESIQTRTFSNYNHSHTLTILYYEVLRHYRVTVEWMRRRPAVLINKPAPITNFDTKALLAHRFLLEPSLLDPSQKSGFDALEKQEAIRDYQTAQNITTSDVWTQPAGEGDIEFSLFEFGIRTASGDTDDTDELVMINLILVDGTTVGRPLVRAWEKGNQTEDANVGNRFNYNNEWGWFIAKPDQPVKWARLMGFEFVLHDNDEWRFNGLAINGFHAGGKVGLLDMVTEITYWFPLNGSSNTVTYIKRPAPPPPAVAPIRAPEKQLSQEEVRSINRLTSHFSNYKEYYSRVLQLNTDPNTIAVAFETEPWTAGEFAADHVDPSPLEVFGSYVAYPLAKQVSGVDDSLIVDIAAALNGTDPARRQAALDRLAAMNDADRQTVLERLPLASAKSERLITMPTRGVFAEGKLGHCNVSEEIDNTRFWKWEEHPIPIEAPEISPVAPIQPQPQQVSATPTAFPQSLVNIVSPSPAPDPTGLTAALTLLGTPSIFRDMSGRQEVADLLKELSDNTISIAEAANRAREIQAKYGVDLDKNQKELQGRVAEALAGVAGKAVEAQSRRAQDAADKKQDLDYDKAKLEAAKEHLPPAQQKPVRTEIAKKWTQAAKTIEVHFRFKHGLSKQILDGEFQVEIEGPTIEFLDILTSGGSAKGNIPKWAPGDYGISIKGTRTRLPQLVPATLTVPKIGNRESFDVALNKYIELKGLELSGNGKIKIDPGTEHIVVSVSAAETSTEITQEIDYSREQGVHLQAEVGIGAKFKDVELGSVKTGGTSIDVGTNSNKYIIKLPFTYLTGGLEISQ